MSERHPLDALPHEPLLDDLPDSPRLSEILAEVIACIDLQDEVDFACLVLSVGQSAHLTVCADPPVRVREPYKLRLGVVVMRFRHILQEVERLEFASTTCAVHAGSPTLRTQKVDVSCSGTRCPQAAHMLGDRPRAYAASFCSHFQWEETPWR